jgi:hypothetical protein
MGNTVYRIVALIAGAALVIVALLTSAGAAIIVPIAMGVAAHVVRRRGERLTPANSWLISVLTYSGILTLVVVWAATLGPMRGAAGQFAAGMDSARKRPPPPPPAFLRSLPIPPPQPLQPTTAKIVDVVGGVMGLELLGLLTGSLCWAGVTLVVSGVTAPRSRQPATLPPST